MSVEVPSHPSHWNLQDDNVSPRLLWMISLQCGLLEFVESTFLSNNEVLIALRWKKPKIVAIAPSIFRNISQPFPPFSLLSNQRSRGIFLEGSPWHPEVLYRFEGHQCTARGLIFQSFIEDVSWEGIISACYKPCCTSIRKKGNTLQVIICNLYKLFRTKYLYLYLHVYKYLQAEIRILLNQYRAVKPKMGSQTS